MFDIYWLFWNSTLRSSQLHALQLKHLDSSRALRRPWNLEMPNPWNAKSLKCQILEMPNPWNAKSRQKLWWLLEAANSTVYSLVLSSSEQVGLATKKEYMLDIERYILFLWHIYREIYSIYMDNHHHRQEVEKSFLDSYVFWRRKKVWFGFMKHKMFSLECWWFRQ